MEAGHHPVGPQVDPRQSGPVVVRARGAQPQGAIPRDDVVDDPVYGDARDHTPRARIDPQQLGGLGGDDPQGSAREHAVDREATEADDLHHPRLAGRLGRLDRTHREHDDDEQGRECGSAGERRSPAAHPGAACRPPPVCRVPADDLAPQLSDEVAHPLRPLRRRSVARPRETRWRTAASLVCSVSANSG